MYAHEIPKQILDKYNITYVEFLYLLLLALHPKIDDLPVKLLNKNIGILSKTSMYMLIQKDKKLLTKILNDYNNYLSHMKRENMINKEFLEYAEELQKLYPKGTRPGSSAKWRGNKLTIAKKLTTISKDFGVSFTKEQAIDATKRYIESFNGDYSYMECLEYFILRERPTFKSNFLSYLEDDDESKNDNNWNVDIR